MKLAYVGDANHVARALVERFGQESNDVYLLADADFTATQREGLAYRHYPIPRNNDQLHDVLRSISPDFIMYAGSFNGTHGQRTQEQAAADIALFERVLAASDTLASRIILLSSTAVYGNTPEPATENAERKGVTEEGKHYKQLEQLMQNLPAVAPEGQENLVLRASELYTNTPHEGDDSFLALAFARALKPQRRGYREDTLYQPLHVADFAQACLRIMQDGTHAVYNVCGSHRLLARTLYRDIVALENIPESAIVWLAPEVVTIASNDLLKSELGWSDFRNLEQQLKDKQITYQRSDSEQKKTHKNVFANIVRPVIENLVIFAAFFIISLISVGNPDFASINWLLIYVIIIAISYNVYQSALAATLASVAYLLIAPSIAGSASAQNTPVFAAQHVLVVLEYIFLGLLVSYTVNALREKNKTLHTDLKALRDDYKDLEVINNENVFIKNEYEDRLLVSKMGMPRLYNLISRLLAQQPDRILMEMVHVVSELVNTDTVAVYRGKANNPYLRLLHALNEESAVEGKTWNLSSNLRLYEAIQFGELYQGEFGSNEPAVVLPILCDGVPEAVIVIRNLPYESETLYHMNLLKTLSLLLRDCMSTALHHEDLMRAERYIEGTDIMKPQAFAEQIELAREKAQKKLAPYCIVKLQTDDDPKQASAAATRTLRTTDYLGMDEDGQLQVLLNNTEAADVEHLKKRLSQFSIVLVEDGKA